MGQDGRGFIVLTLVSIIILFVLCYGLYVLKPKIEDKMNNNSSNSNSILETE